MNSETEKGKTTGTVERDTVLRVATISTDNISFYDLTRHIESWAYMFEAQHKNVDVVIESMDAVERLQAELMAGKGPDVILSPTYTECEILNAAWPVGNIPTADVNLAMRNGIFYDISEFYDADTELNKDALAPAVMDAGVVDGKRYVLPLRYNLLAAYVDLDVFEATGLSIDIFEKDIIGFWDALTQYGNGPIIRSALIRSSWRSQFNLIGELIDYDNQEILLSPETLVKYLQAYQNYRIASGKNRVSDYALLHKYHSPGTDDAFSNINSGWMNVMEPKCMFVGGLDFSIHNAVIAEAEGINLGMYPLRSTDGSVIADITFYGAVTGGSKNPELAYEFLRYFLTEQSQWEQNVPFTIIKDSRLMVAGWPVRVKGSAGALYNHLKGWTYPIALRNEENKTMADVEPYTEDDIPILNVTIDKARFPTGLEMSFHNLAASLYNPNTMTEGQARAMDLEKMAADFIEELEWHLFEG